MKFETENIEFKSRFTTELYKEVIAFANTDGGTIYVGVDDQGEVVGTDDPDEDFAKITNGIRDAIVPDVTMFVKYSILEQGVICITVGEGSFKPYYLRAKGLKSSGVFVRQGTTSVPASSEQIRAMIKDSDGNDFETMRSMEQSLTFDSAEEAFKRYGVEFSPAKYRALGITLADGNIYSNLALIISDQCTHTTKIAVFDDGANTKFRDSKVFEGSVFEQLDKAYSYLTLCNKKTATFRGLERIEKPDYPEEALREALLNAIVHRDYSFSGSVIINVNEDEIEFISIGGLLPGLSAEDIRNGISQPRNNKLAEIFHRLHLIESYGTGIRKIYHFYQSCHKQPRIEITSNTFKIVLPNMNKQPLNEKKSGETEQMQKILDYIEQNGYITDEKVQWLLSVGRTRAFNITKQMRDMGLIKADARGSNKKYFKL